MQTLPISTVMFIRNVIEENRQAGRDYLDLSNNKLSEKEKEPCFFYIWPWCTTEHNPLNSHLLAVFGLSDHHTFMDMYALSQIVHNALMELSMKEH